MTPSRNVRRLQHSLDFGSVPLPFDMIGLVSALALSDSNYRAYITALHVDTHSESTDMFDSLCDFGRVAVGDPVLTLVASVQTKNLVRARVA